MDKNYQKENSKAQTKNKHLSVPNEKSPEGQSSARMFESSSNFGAEEKVTMDTEDSKLQKQNLAVIRNILAMFNLDETKKKYESQNVQEYVLDPNDFGYDW